MLAPKLKQPPGPALFLLSEAADLDTYANVVARDRLRVRRWEARRTWVGRALIGLGFPIAFLLLTISTGTPATQAEAGVMLALWAVLALVGAVCAFAAWRGRVRLDRLETPRLY